MIERSADYSPSDERAWREAQDRWHASEDWWHPDPMGDDDLRWAVDRFFGVTIALLLTCALIGAAVYINLHGV